MSAVSDLLCRPRRATPPGGRDAERDCGRAVGAACGSVTFARGRGFVTYRDPAAPMRRRSGDSLGAALRHYQADPAITHVEWKSRGHDLAPGLHEALIEHGFEPDPPESIMVGEARLLVADVPLPAGVTIRTIREPREVARMCAMQAEVFGDLDPEPMTLSLLERLARNDGMSLWIAEADGELITAGRLEPVAGTAFAGIWGGATRSGLARARRLSRADGRACARRAGAGKTLIHSDSTDFLATHPRGLRSGEGVDDDAVQLGAPDGPWCTPSPLRSRE